MARAFIFFLNGAFIFLNGAFIFVNAAFIFVNGAFIFVNAALFIQRSGDNIRWANRERLVQTRQNSKWPTVSKVFATLYVLGEIESISRILVGPSQMFDVQEALEKID